MISSVNEWSTKGGAKYGRKNVLLGPNFIVNEREGGIKNVTIPNVKIKNNIYIPSGYPLVSREVQLPSQAPELQALFSNLQNIS